MNIDFHAWLDRAARSTASRFLTAALMAGLAGRAVAGQEPRLVRWTFTLENTRDTTAHDVTLLVRGPAVAHAQRHVTLRSHPDGTVLKDAFGNRVLQITVDKVAPLATRAVQVEADVDFGEAVPESPELQSRYLHPDRLMPSDNPVIAGIARALGGDSPNEIARSAFQWTVDHIVYAGYIGEERGALWAIQHQRGDCTEMACTFAALCRARGVATRVLGGYLCDRNCILTPNLYHNWAEYYADGGWHMVDAQFKLFDADPQLYLVTNILPPPLQEGETAFDFQQASLDAEGIHIVMDSK